MEDSDIIIAVVLLKQVRESLQNDLANNTSAVKTEIIKGMIDDVDKIIKKYGFLGEFSQRAHLEKLLP